MDAKTRLLNLKEVAARTGMSYSTIKRWNRSGFLPSPYKRSGSSRIRGYWTEEQLGLIRDQVKFGVVTQVEQPG